MRQAGFAVTKNESVIWLVTYCPQAAARPLASQRDEPDHRTNEKSGDRGEVVVLDKERERRRRIGGDYGGGDAA
jgi:hypothetical protein